MTDIGNLVWKIILRIVKPYIKSIEWYKQERKLIIQLREDPEIVFGQLYPFLLDLANNGIEVNIYG